MNGLMIVAIGEGIVSIALFVLAIVLAIRLREEGLNSDVSLQEVGFKEKCIRSALDEMGIITGHLKSIDEESSLLAEELEKKEDELEKLLKERNDDREQFGQKIAILKRILPKLTKRGVFLVRRDNGKFDELHRTREWADLHKIAGIPNQHPKKEEQPKEVEQPVMAQ